MGGSEGGFLVFNVGREGEADILWEQDKGVASKRSPTTGGPEGTSATAVPRERPADASTQDWTRASVS